MPLINGVLYAALLVIGLLVLLDAEAGEGSLFFSEPDGDEEDPSPYEEPEEDLPARRSGQPVR